MTNVQSVSRIKRPDRGVILTAVILVLIYALVFVLEQILPPTSMLFTVLKKGATYALVAVSMNLLNGFTGLFSLGQAGFMLIGAYTYGILTIPDTELMFLPLLGVVPLQLFAYYVALMRGCDIDKPRNLAKSVTVE